VSVVIPFADCIARPDTDGVRFGLPEHLEAVAWGCGRSDGTPEERLAFLAGLLHDAAKAAVDWQRNINPPRPGRPPHAPLGAALFAFWADDLIPRWLKDQRREKPQLFDLALDWARVVYDHHSEMHDLGADPPWRGQGGTGMCGLLATLDHPGLVGFVRRFFCEARDLSAFLEWLDAADNGWHKRWKIERGLILQEAKRCRGADDVPLAAEGLRLARLGALLVFADRAHVADWAPEEFPPAAAGAAADALEAALRTRARDALDEQQANPELVAARGRLNAAALAGYRADAAAAVFTLLLPTGFGKTLAGLRVALEACRSGRCRRIVYVAPYLSILSQAAREIADAAGLDVFVHHHLTAATLEDHQPYDPLDTWQAPVVATTFNQLFRALFPARAQQCLRRPALDGAFLLIDEPQIIGKEVWNLFLRALAITCREQGGQALLLTATLPPADAGLGFVPVELVKRSDIGTLPADRYVIHAGAGEWDTARTAKEACKRFDKCGSVAVILNTVRDACDVYRRVKERSAGRWRFLAAAMLPGHKAKVIADVRRMLKTRKEGRARPPVGVVCTQVLEAGVDLSFRALLRALPVFPSVVQAAGRANRHAAATEPAEVVVFDYRRDGGKESRPFIYDSEHARRATDALLAARVPLRERDVPSALDAYFRALWAAEPVTAPLQRFEKSARGEWSALAGLTPFDGDDSWRVDVFVAHQDGDRFLSPRMARLLYRFAPDGPAQLLARLTDPAFRRTLRDRRDRKRLFALVRQFTVAVPKKVAERVAARTGLDWLWVLDDPASYSEETGLAHLLGAEAEEPGCQIL
jgi:CRISPR-associated endonuclease/helicase Cas3